MSCSSLSLFERTSSMTTSDPDSRLRIRVDIHRERRPEMRLADQSMKQRLQAFQRRPPPRSRKNCRLARLTRFFALLSVLCDSTNVLYRIMPDVFLDFVPNVRGRSENAMLVTYVKSGVSIHHLWCQSRHLALTRVSTPVSRIFLRPCQAPPQVYNLVMADHSSWCLFLEAY
jgi:hypothetical protein